MPLPIPSLDRRTFGELVAEGRSLLPRHAPGWTDHNVHDPGITLLELFAWLAEMDIYRLDYTPEASVRAFLRLLGIEPRPAQVAEAVLIFSAAAPLALPAASRVSDAAGQTIFQVARDVHVSPATLTAAFTGKEKADADVTVVNAKGSPCGTYPFPSQ